MFDTCGLDLSSDHWPECPVTSLCSSNHDSWNLVWPTACHHPELSCVPQEVIAVMWLAPVHIVFRPCEDYVISPISFIMKLNHGEGDLSNMPKVTEMVNNRPQIHPCATMTEHMWSQLSLSVSVHHNPLDIPYTSIKSLFSQNTHVFTLLLH